MRQADMPLTSPPRDEPFRCAPATDIRVDPFLGSVVHVVTSRQGRPNLPSSGCPFCVGGLEAPEPYAVRSFPNRWPALGEGRCEVVLYTPDHDATFAELGVDGARRVIDLWASRTEALATHDEVEFVLVFENRGADVGATIPHPHGQIYAFDHVPSRPHRRLLAGWRPDRVPGPRQVAHVGDWRCWSTQAPIYPVSLTLSPDGRVANLIELSSASRGDLAALLVDVLDRLDRLHDRALPYMMWINQVLPSMADRYERPWLNIEIVSPWRSAGVSRFIAAAEVACEEYFNPVHPDDLAEALRSI